MNEHGLYFAYGSNLNAGDWCRWCREQGEDPSVLAPVTHGWLADHRPIYRYESGSRGGGALDVIPDIGHLAPGVLFAVAGNGWDLLDRKEGAPTCYRRSRAIALTEDGDWREVITYCVNPARRQSFVAPTDVYADIVRAGLCAHDLPTDQHDRVARNERPAPLVNHLFVYGLLQSGASLGQAVKGVRGRQAAGIPGRLYDLGAYPGWQPSPDPSERVHGELLELADPASALIDCDRIEGCAAYSTEALYHRVLVRATTESGQTTLAWCYRIASPGNAPRMLGGRWQPESEALTQFERIAAAAKSKLGHAPVLAANVLAKITVSYRQSRQLNDLARAMIRAVGGTEQNASLPAHMDHSGVTPALLEQAADRPVIVSWLADRIREIERFVDQLPSTAIFVNSESDVVPMTEALNAALAEHNIQVMACHAGQAVGTDGNVRVFDVQHIKGLEFEAVFFIGIDQLARLHPTLFDKYLYVGATRAATYLGVTCEGTLPAAIESLRTHFSQDWQTPVP